MIWHYQVGEETKGPVSSAELVQLHKSGDVSDDTLVLCTGLPGWTTYREACPESVADEVPVTVPQPPPLAPPAPRVSAPSPRSAVRPLRDAAWARNLGAAYVAPAAALPPPLPVRPAGFWIRVLARIIDLFTMVIAWYFVLAAWMVAAKGLSGLSEPSEKLDEVIPEWAMMSIPLLIAMTYLSLCHGLAGATLGKKICSLAVITTAQTRVSLLRAWWRFIAESLMVGVFWTAFTMLIIAVGSRSLLLFILLALLLIPFACLPYAIAAFTPQKQGLHDYLAGTMVIRI